MAETLTPQQLQAVTDRGGKLLVSAAAGSGKTKVLVDRLLSYLTDPVCPANLDEFLIITYTKAAASELRGKIAAKLTERIAVEPENRHLQQQLQRLYLTKVCTVHSFCSDILQEYSYQLDISSDFRVADENECLELQLRSVQKVLDEAYETAMEDSDFRAFIDSQGLGRDDRQIPQILLKVYDSARCHLDPEQWLDWCVSVGSGATVQDAADTVWGRYLINDLHSYLDLQISALQRCVQKASLSDGMDKAAALLSSTVDQLATLRNCATWDGIRDHMDIDYGRLNFPKTCTDTALAEKIKAIRQSCKDGVARKLRKFSDSSKRVLEDVAQSASASRGLVSLTKKFSNTYQELKRCRGILDFGDLEHKTLDLLLGRKRSGPTKIALEIGQRFREVMVDEYQDSNAVQDAIFNAITQKRQNCFMVGDVKQSIYQFRLADPGIFLEKYHSFVSPDEARKGQGRKVILSSNFRSSGSVINAVNDVFATCMSPQVGGLVYGDEEKLKEGIPHVPLDEAEIELYGINIQHDTYAEEASFVAERICQLLDGTHMVRQGDSVRPIAPDDIVILLRSPGSVGSAYQRALEQRGIRCTTGGSEDLLHTEEIETFRAILRIINNPLQDIPLVAALSSRVFSFTADELAVIRAGRRTGDFFHAIQICDSPKCKAFLETLSVLRREARMNSLSRLLTRVLEVTRIDSIYASLSDGAARVENLQSFCQVAAAYETAGFNGLHQFLAHLDIMEERGLAVQSQQNNSGSVTIMSIHKSKGLEFPVVFLCGLAREFNRESARAQVLCDKELGLGLSCVDMQKRVRYPTIAKRAISEKMIAESLSEEMRVLYVAMTRARDRLIMTYSLKEINSELTEISQRMGMSDPLLLTGEADCPGLWVLLTALKHRHNGWSIQVTEAPNTHTCLSQGSISSQELLPQTLEKIEKSLAFRYAHLPATKTPSKQTATQLKGREKDREAAEHTREGASFCYCLEPSFYKKTDNGIAYGSAIHTVMEHIRYDACVDKSGVENEITRLVEEHYISSEQGKIINVDSIVRFFATDVGKKLRVSDCVLREFKFSILVDAQQYDPDVINEKVLLQGVVDCAIIEHDGITVIDFKSDRVMDETFSTVVDRYRTQIITYAEALSRVYELPIKSALLYFFDIDRSAAIM